MRKYSTPIWNVLQDRLKLKMNKRQKVFIVANFYVTRGRKNRATLSNVLIFDITNFGSYIRSLKSSYDKAGSKTFL